MESTSRGDINALMVQAAQLVTEWECAVAAIEKTRPLVNERDHLTNFLFWANAPANADEGRESAERKHLVEERKRLVAFPYLAEESPESIEQRRNKLTEQIEQIQSPIGPFKEKLSAFLSRLRSGLNLLPLPLTDRVRDLLDAIRGIPLVAGNIQDVFDIRSDLLAVQLRLSELLNLLQPDTHSGAHITLPAAVTTFGEIAIRFTSEHRFSVMAAPDFEQSYSYEDLGFRDGRSKKPNTAWRYLRILAERGVVPATDKKVQKGIQTLRKQLWSLFDLDDHPIYLGRDGYRASFKLERERS